MPPLVKNMADTALLFVLFFAVGLATRLPALSLQELYGLHAVLAAPLYSLAIAASIRSRNASKPWMRSPQVASYNFASPPN